MKNHNTRKLLSAFFGAFAFALLACALVGYFGAESTDPSLIMSADGGVLFPALAAMTLSQLVERRGKVLDEINSIHDNPSSKDAEGKDTGELSDEQRSKVENLEKELTAIDGKVDIKQREVDRRNKQAQLEQRARDTDTGHLHPHVSGGRYRGEQREIASFNLGRALRLAYEGRALDGAEAEFTQEGANEARQAGIEIQSNAIMVGSVALSTGMERRDHSVTASGAAGGNLVQTGVGSLLDALFERLVFSRMGNVDINTGLVGNLQINRIVRGTAPTEKAENAAADEHTITFVPHNLTPTRLPTYADVSKQLFIQSNERNLERRISNHILSEMRVKMEKVYIATILATSGIGAVVGGTNGALPTYADIVNLAGALTDANVDPDMIKYLINTAVQSYLMTAPKAVDGNGDAVDSVKILSESATKLAGRDYLISNVVPSDLDKGSASGVCSAILAGDGSGLSLGQWSGLEFLIDPFTQAATGMNRIHCAVYHDGVVNDPAKWAAMQDALTA